MPIICLQLTGCAILCFAKSLKPQFQHFELEKHEAKSKDQYYTVKLTRAKLPANVGNFTCGMHVKGPHTQLTCVICRLPVKTVTFTRVYAASTWHRIHATASNKAFCW